MTIGSVSITVADNNGSTLLVQPTQIQAVFGCTSAGTPNTPLVTRSVATLIATLGYGPAVQAGASVIDAGGIAVVTKTTQNAAGTVRNLGAVGGGVTAATNATPIVVTTSSAHGLLVGDIVTIAGVGGNTAANGTFVVSAKTNTTITLLGSAGSGAYTSGGTVTDTGLRWLNSAGTVPTSTLVPSYTLDATNGAFDELYVRIKFPAGGTIGTTGILFQVSLDAGRTFGPQLALGTATSYVIPNTGITVTFTAAQTIVAGDYLTFGTIAPLWNTGGVNSAITALKNSPAAIAGWGSMQLAGICAGSDVTTIQGYLDTLATGKIFTRLITQARDASPPHAYGGTSETDSAWATAIATDYSAVAAKREATGAGYYNFASSAGLANAAYGAPRYRRPIGNWGLAIRKIGAPAQILSSQVSNGTLQNLVVDPVNDPLDGFVYHDESQNPSLDAVRFVSALTRVGFGSGYFIASENLMSAPGSQFSLLALGAVMDIACNLSNTAATRFVDSTIRLNPNGTIYETDARRVESAIKGFVDAGTTGMVSQGCVVTIDRGVNVALTGNVNITVTIYQLGYARTINLTIGFANSLAAT